MRVGILNTQVPFTVGGAERHSANLCAAFRERGFDATEISLPFKWYPARTLVDNVLAAKLLDVSEANGLPIDLAVGLKFPAYLAQHPNKVFWVIHQHRQAYDMWDSGSSDMLDDPLGVAVRALIHEEDRRAIGAEGTRVYANSRNVSDRLLRFTGLASSPLYHPPPMADAMRQGEYGDYLFAPSRMNEAKRQMLMLEALALCSKDTRIVFAGPADNPDFERQLKEKARSLGLEKQVTWLGSIDDETMKRYYAEARGVVFVPVDEDYGYITLEAMLSGKPVITATDSGGPLEFINDGVEGIVVEPESSDLARAFDLLSGDAAMAERMGSAGLSRYNSLNIGWDHVISTLTNEAASGADPLTADPAAELRHASQGLTSGKIQRPNNTSVTDPIIDLNALKTLIAPPIPEESPFASIDDLISTYDFGTYTPDEGTAREDMVPYFQTHWTRYLSTLALALDGRTDRVLDVGVFPPFLFQAMLAAARPDTVLDGVWEREQPFAQTVRSRKEKFADFSVSLSSANVERSPLPFEDSTYDLVLGMEILEHLAIDPLFFLAEAVRVLRPGGRIVLTTPNVTSHRGVRKILDGNAPYSFGVFVPTGGVYGRHNREYTPQEVAHLCESAGFETETLRTADLYDDHIDLEVAQLLANQPSFEMRGETILYVGRRDGLKPAQVPHNLYHGDPRQLSGQVSLTNRTLPSGEVQLSITNQSSVSWHAVGDNAVGLFLEWRDERGALVHDAGYVDLPVSLMPGESTEMLLGLDIGPSDGRTGIACIELYQSGAGRMTDAGRANKLELSCSEAAFLRIVRGTL